MNFGSLDTPRFKYTQAANIRPPVNLLAKNATKLYFSVNKTIDMGHTIKDSTVTVVTAYEFQTRKRS